MDTGISILVLGCLSIGLVAAGFVEWWCHLRNLRRIPVRIHVNGTRGKSSVTRLIAAGLRASGRRVCAKTTGTLPRMMMPDGSEYPIFRPSTPNIIEQCRIVSAAVAHHADVLVVECMALQPRLQALSERQLIRATHAVITNARSDHLEVMGPTESDVALALCGMIPQRDGALFCADPAHHDIYRACAADRNARVTWVTGTQIAAINSETLQRFSYIEHAENIALALAVCEALGVAREAALQQMITMTPDPGAMTCFNLEFFARKLHFINAFAANDPQSTGQLWKKSLSLFPNVNRRIAVFNCRADRPERSVLLAQAYRKWPAADVVVAIGDGAPVFYAAALKAGVAPDQVVVSSSDVIPSIFELLVECAGAHALIVGMGNIGGIGLALVRHFRNRSLPADVSPEGALTS